MAVSSNGDLSSIRMSTVREYSLDRLFRLLNALGRDIEIVIRQPRSAESA
ncbi:MAG: hypothetical protein OYH76_06460 [Defluviicoccus sp.]|nr:hypothetical protein [Defluviicoccus sp.]MDE0275519.1 hypothetical protein [Defluviicoccus sp.]